MRILFEERDAVIMAAVKLNEIDFFYRYDICRLEGCSL
jgi:hypothetical protein